MTSVVHPRTLQQLDEFTQKPGHALLVSGPTGLGKLAMVEEISLKLLQSTHPSSENEPGILKLSPEKGTISIDAIRQLQHFMSLKTVTDKDISRVAIIQDAHLMSTEAQNALLKLVEEPPLDSVIILTATSEHALLPTIISRVQHIAVSRPSKEELTTFFKSQNYQLDEIAKVYQMSGGLPELMRSLLEQSTDHPLQVAVQNARTILSSKPFERQCLVDSLAKDRQQAIETCEMLGQMATIALKNPTAGTQQADKWQKVLSGALTAVNDLHRYVQPKLVISRYLLSF